MKFNYDGYFFFLKTRYKDRSSDNQIKPEAHRLLCEALDVRVRWGHPMRRWENLWPHQKLFHLVLWSSDAYRESDSAAPEINLSEPGIPRSAEPLVFWERNEGQFPAWEEATRVYLSAPSTSVDSERLFSTAAHVLDEKRNRLSSQNAEKRIVIKKKLAVPT